MRVWGLLCVLVGLLAGPQAAHAQAGEPLEATLNERVDMLPLPGVFPLPLETTFFIPDGPGPFPVVVINHGKALGNPRFQPRNRPIHAVRYFMQRGFAVVAPMRRGFSKSGGSYVGVGCNVESNGREQAQDVRDVLDHVVR
ncbi:MAG: dienelactone hydrolase family protein, partial [Comamonadaceae bacterium]|nr:dienelactone hydrolase family protein [Comamonadaceae bacterium]